MRSLLHRGLLALVAASLAVGCTTTEPGASSGAEQDVISAGPATSLSNVKVEPGVLSWGRSAIYGGNRAKVAGVHAFLFEGEAGDRIVLTSRADTPGTAYILAKTSEGFTVVAKTAGTGVQSEVKATLAAAGTYAVAYEALVSDEKEDPDALFPTSHSVELTLGGTPVSEANRLVIAVRTAWEESTDYPGTAEQWKALDAKKLPPEARALHDKWNTDFAPEGASAATWKVNGVDVFVVQSWHDNGLSLAFFDPQGKIIGIGAALEDHDFSWDDHLGL